MDAKDLYQKLKDVKIGGHICRFTMEKCRELAPLINEINQLKKEKNAVILVHSYVSAEIAYGVGDFVGDSYGLSKDAMNTKADVIIFCAVKFMAETAKILNPEKEVLIPSELNGCTLADSITHIQVQKLKREFPDYTFVCYINTTADVKAECDVCVTSSNCYDIIEAIPNDKIMFLPDKLMGKNIIKEMESRGVKKDIKLTNGTCYVHEEYAPEMIDYIRLQYPQAEVLSHPECHPNVIQKSDFIGSTAQLLKHMKSSKSKEFLLLTECGLSSHFQVEMPEKKIVGTCTLCKYMKSNTLEDIFRVLKNPRPQDRIVIEESTRGKALKSLQEMFRYTENKVAVPAA
ncbi:quinolinate synthase NadA [PVC group bacterium]|nr:quinolinate synthase NadA [PVC group bacterium]